jgi:hypothetical protein
MQLFSEEEVTKLHLVFFRALNLVPHCALSFNQINFFDNLLSSLEFNLFFIFS